MIGLSVIGPVRRWGVRLTFTGEHRTRFYDALQFMLSNNVRIKDALEKMSDAWTDFGTRWHPYAELTGDLIDALRDNSGNNTLAMALARWLPADEAAVLNAGIESGNLSGALISAKELTGARKRVMAAVLQMSIYPLVLAFMMTGLLVTLNLKLIPTLSRMSPPETWSGMLGFLWWLSGVLDRYWPVFVLVAVFSCILVFYSVPRLTTPFVLRKALDKFLPWSLYKDVQGSAFLLNLASLLKAGVSASDAFLLMNKTASPYLSVRLMAAHSCLRKGSGPAAALRECGMDFPSREAVNFLSMLDGDGSTEILENYGRRWLEESIVGIQRRAVIVRLVMLMALLSTLMLMVVIVSEVLGMSSAAGLA